jgi:serine/threonine protein kinase
LFDCISGNRGGGRTPLDWVTRVRIALGAARGLQYLHAQGGTHRFVHGNIKSSNVLLNRDLEACISDFGLAQLLSSTAAASRIVGYRAPEITETRKVTQKSDVYSFGVVSLSYIRLFPLSFPYHSKALHECKNLPRIVECNLWICTVSEGWV